jgi:hypothetical protein
MSEDLQKLTPFLTNVASGGVIRYIEPRSALVYLRFYRAIVP